MLLLKLLLLIFIMVFIWFVWSVVRDLRRMFGGGAAAGRGPGSGRKAGGWRRPRPEECPNCRRRVWLREEELICPQCKVKLARSPDGKLLVRIN